MNTSARVRQRGEATGTDCATACHERLEHDVVPTDIAEQTYRISKTFHREHHEYDLARAASTCTDSHCSVGIRCQPRGAQATSPLSTRRCTAHTHAQTNTPLRIALVTPCSDRSNKKRTNFTRRSSLVPEAQSSTDTKKGHHCGHAPCVPTATEAVH